VVVRVWWLASSGAERSAPEEEPQLFVAAAERGRAGHAVRGRDLTAV
jgi:hypothetical protein